MNKSRLQYQRETGRSANPKEVIVEVHEEGESVTTKSWNVFPEEYVEYLENIVNKTEEDYVKKKINWQTI